MKINPLLLEALALALLLAGCSEPYKPGLGELMSLNQMRLAKLWFAGEERNWPLADYEMDELQEGFDDVVRLHPMHKESPLPITELVPKIMSVRLTELRAAVAARDWPRFQVAYDDVTLGCNSCHKAMNVGFIVVKRPTTAGWFGNQDFAAGRE